MYFQFSLKNFLKTKNVFESLWVFCSRISKNKNLEIQLLKSNQYLFKLELDCSIIGKDHAGISLELELLNYGIMLTIYDSRHWDYENGCWETFNEEI